ncbi:mannosyl-oligosaccharide alpha-1,2-mannosidase, partial [Ceratobasidium sp. 392]
MLSDISPGVETIKPSANSLTKPPPATVVSPRNTLSSNTGLVIAYNEPTSGAKPAPAALPKEASQQEKSTGLPFDEEAKLVYGVLLSLRHMAQKLSGRPDEAFSSYTTSTYKLHYFETMSGYKFIMLTDPSADALRFILRQIYTGPFIEHVRVVILSLGSIVFLWVTVKFIGRSGIRPQWIPEEETVWSWPVKETKPKGPLTDSDYTLADPVRREAIVKAFKHAWSGYERDAFGCDDYHPVSRTGTNLTTDRGVGYMIADALDTMLIMGKDLSAEYRRARDWIAKDLDFDRDGRYSTFEITIRVLGGLLSAYALSGKDAIYLQRAQELADRLLPAFNTPHGLPVPNVNFHSEPKPNWGAEPVSTAEAATLQLEFKYLSHITGKEVYWRAAEKVMKVVKNALGGDNVVDGALVPIHMRFDAQTGEFVASDIRLGSRGDSYYEYLLKQYLQTNRTETVYRT